MNQPETRDEALARGKKEGAIDALLEEHTSRLNQINGSVAQTGRKLGEVVVGLTAQRRDIADLTTAVDGIVPQVKKLVEEGIGTKQVAEALDTQKTADNTGQDRIRAFVAWTLGIVTGFVGVIATTVLIIRLITG